MSARPPFAADLEGSPAERLRSSGTPTKDSSIDVRSAVEAVLNVLPRRQELLPLIRLTAGTTLPAADILRLVADSLSQLNPVPSIEISALGKVVDPFENPVVPRASGDSATWVRPAVWKEEVTKIESTTPSGAKIAVAMPRRWNGRLLVLAHGFRPEGVGLIADLDVEEPCLARLLKDGWIVGMSSYRSDGLVVQDAVSDMNELRAFVVAARGEPSLTLLEGRSMGGAIATLIAEQHPELYQGVVAIGAALLVEGAAFNHVPRVPLLFLTNQSELGSIQKYLAGVERARKDHSDEIITPALWEVWREGHNLVTQSERQAALDAVLSWVEHRTNITMRSRNVFWGPVAGERARPATQRGVMGIAASVTNVHPVFKSFSMNVTADDMSAAGIRPNKFYNLIVGDTTLRVLYGSYPFLVDQGTWISFDHPDGYLIADIFGWFDVVDAGRAAGVVKGTSVFIHPL